jgi:Putative DNA-binding domain
MIRTANEATPPVNLTNYLQSNLDNSDFVLRRRSVLIYTAQDHWVLAISVVQAFPDKTLRPEPQLSRKYDRIQLLEDWLDVSQVRKFIESIQAGTMTIADLSLTRTSGSNWQSEFVAPPNNFMDRVGFVVQTKFEQHQITLAQEPLISATEPYYPDDATALQDWAALTLHHGYNDGRNGHIVFLLPEAGAYFTSAVSDNGTLRLSLGGSAIGSIPLIVKGAYRYDGKLHHFGRQAIGDRVEFLVPNEVERLEYALIDLKARLYDLQRESWGAQTGSLRQKASTPDDALVQHIRDAVESGEGPKVEFKPFIDLDEAPGGIREKTKFREVLRTIAAFANTEGGSIFFGVEDDCMLEGIQEGLAKWGDCEPNEDLRTRYKGTLTNKLCDHLLGDIHFGIAFATVDDVLIAILSVAQHESAPVGLKDDGYYYVRRGSNSVRLLPHEWPSVPNFRQP